MLECRLLGSGVEGLGLFLRGTIMTYRSIVFLLGYFKVQGFSVGAGRGLRVKGFREGLGFRVECTLRARSMSGLRDLWASIA